MSAKKPAIPSVRMGRADLDQFFAATKATLDAMTGQANNVERLPQLATTATLPELIAQFNKLTERMQ